MSPLTWRLLAAILGLLCVSLTSVQSKEVGGFKYNISLYDRKEIIFSREPLTNDALLFAACDIRNPGVGHGSDFPTNCRVFLSPYPTSEGVTTSPKHCKLDFESRDKYIVTGLDLKRFNSDQVIVTWIELVGQDDRARFEQLVCRTINMSNCEAFEHKIRLKRRQVEEGYQVVPYRDSFNVFYLNASLCKYACVQTVDKQGRIIRGPVDSSVSSAYVDIGTFLYPVKPESSALGYFGISNELELISSGNGENKMLLTYPMDIEASSVTNGYLGWCSKRDYTNSDKMPFIHCEQFDSQGEQSMKGKIEMTQDTLVGETREEQVKNIGSWMTVSNLRDGSMILLITNNPMYYKNPTCDFNVYKLQKVGVGVHETKVERLDKISYDHCDHVWHVKAGIHELENGDICITFANDHGYDTARGETYIPLMSKCIRLSESERD